MLTLIWITRDCEKEPKYLDETFSEILQYKDKLSELPQIILVGRTTLDLSNFGKFHELNIQFIETPQEWDERGLICHKKNTAIKAANGEICIVMHADVSLPLETLQCVINYRSIHKRLRKKYVLTPIAFIKHERMKRALTWCDISQNDRFKSISQEYDENTYISGAILIATRQVLNENPWNEELGYGKAEDVELSKRMYKNGCILKCDPRLVVYISDNQ